jgi:Zn finger protein HypA/HybF involved in hydrogenase expression
VHELGLIEDWVKSVRASVAAVKEEGRVNKIHVKLGRDSEVKKDVLSFWFENFTKGTELEGVVLDVVLKDGKDILFDSLEVE